MESAGPGKERARGKALERVVERDLERSQPAFESREAKAEDNHATLVVSAHKMLGNALVQGSLSGEFVGIGTLLQDALSFGSAGVNVASDVSTLLANSYVNDWIGANGVGTDPFGGNAVSFKKQEPGVDLTDPSLAVIGQGGGALLPDSVRARMESAFGRDFSSVRIHTGSQVGHAAAALNARAFAIGDHIYFGNGEFAPGTPSGDHLLAHELTHVVQAADGRLPSATSRDTEVSSPNDPHELEAERVAGQVVGELAQDTPSADLAEAAPPSADASVAGVGGVESAGAISRVGDPGANGKPPPPPPDTSTATDDKGPIPDPNVMVQEKKNEVLPALQATEEQKSSTGGGKTNSKPGTRLEPKTTNTSGVTTLNTSPLNLAPNTAPPLGAPVPQFVAEDQCLDVQLSGPPRTKATLGAIVAMAELRVQSMTSAKTAQHSAIDAAVTQQKKAVQDALPELNKQIYEKYGALKLQVRHRAIPTMQGVRREAESAKGAITKQGQGKIAELQQAVEERRKSFHDAQQERADAAKAAGQDASAAVLRDAGAAAEAASGRALSVAEKYSSSKRYSEILSAVQELASAAGRTILDQAQTVAKQCITDGEKLSTKILEAAATFEADITGGLEPGQEIIEDGVEAGHDQVDQMYAEVEGLLEDQIEKICGDLDTTAAQVVSDFDAAATRQATGLDEVGKKAKEAVSAGVSKAVTGLNGILAELAPVAAAVHPSRDAEAAKLLGEIDTALADADYTAGILEMGQRGVSSVNDAGAVLVKKITTSVSEVDRLIAKTLEGIDTGLGTFVGKAAEQFAKASAPLEKGFGDAARAVTSAVDECVKEGDEKIGKLLDEGTTDIASRKSMFESRTKAFTAELYIQIDDKAAEVSDDSTWTWLCNRVGSVGRFLKGFFTGFLSKAWDWVKTMATFAMWALVVIVVVVAVVALVILVGPEALAAALISALVWVATVAIPFLTQVCFWIGVGVAVISTARAIYISFCDPMATWEEIGDAWGRAAWDVIEAIDPLKVAKAGFGRARNLVNRLRGLEKAVEAGTQVEKVAEGAKDVAKGADAVAHGAPSTTGTATGGKKWDDPSMTAEEFIKDFRTKKPRSDLTDTELKRAYEKGLRVDDVGVPRVSTDTGVVSGKKWNDTTLTFDEFKADYRAKNTDMKVSDDFLKSQFDKGLRQSHDGRWTNPGKNPSGKTWNDPSLTREEFIADYRARKPKTTMSDSQIGQKFDDGLRYNPTTRKMVPLDKVKPATAKNPLVNPKIGWTEFRDLCQSRGVTTKLGGEAGAKLLHAIVRGGRDPAGALFDMRKILTDAQGTLQSRETFVAATKSLGGEAQALAAHLWELAGIPEDLADLLVELGGLLSANDLGDQVRYGGRNNAGFDPEYAAPAPH